MANVSFRNHLELLLIRDDLPKLDHVFMI
jgi:hypothetical protein